MTQRNGVLGWFPGSQRYLPPEAVRSDQAYALFVFPAQSTALGK